MYYMKPKKGPIVFLQDSVLRCSRKGEIHQQVSGMFVCSVKMFCYYTFMLASLSISLHSLCITFASPLLWPVLPLFLCLTAFCLLQSQRYVRRAGWRDSPLPCSNQLPEILSFPSHLFILVES